MSDKDFTFLCCVFVIIVLSILLLGSKPIDYRSIARSELIEQYDKYDDAVFDLREDFNSKEMQKLRESMSEKVKMCIEDHACHEGQVDILNALKKNIDQTKTAPQMILGNILKHKFENKIPLGKCRECNDKK